MTTFETQSKTEHLIKSYEEDIGTWDLPQAILASSGTTYFPFEDSIFVIMSNIMFSFTPTDYRTYIASRENGNPIQMVFNEAQKNQKIGFFVSVGSGSFPQKVLVYFSFLDNP